MVLVSHARRARPARAVGATLRAYFLGHMGKYVPGKAMAVILRIAAVRQWVPSMRIAIVSTMLETLTMMAVGAFLAAALSAFILRTRTELAALALAIAIAVVAPTLPPVIRRFARLGIGRAKPLDDDARRLNRRRFERHGNDVEVQSAGINYRLLLEGWFAACLLAAAGIKPVGDVAGDRRRGTQPDQRFAAVGRCRRLGRRVGFVSMLPGGLGVRDLALVGLLAQSAAPQMHSSPPCCCGSCGWCRSLPCVLSYI